jgi:hypothetical protein
MINKNTYIKKQMNILSSIGLFYMIIVALFAIPLMGTFVVIAIQGVVDFKYAIIFGSVLLFIIVIFYMVNFFRVISNKIKGDSLNSIQSIKGKSLGGSPVQISAFNGLISFTYGNQIYHNNINKTQFLKYKKEHKASILPFCIKENQNQPDIVTSLKELSELKKQGMINEDEFQTIKKNMIENSNRFKLTA